MGMFDEIYVEYQLPDPEVQFEVFQTKSFHRAMDKYTIDTNGRLIHHMKFYEEVPEEERPYYGKPEWDENPIVQMFGCLNSVSLGDRFMYDFNGEVRFYTYVGGDCYYWYEYISWFRNGILRELITKHYKMELNYDARDEEM